MLGNATNAKVTAFTVSMVGVEGGVVLKLPPPPIKIRIKIVLEQIQPIETYPLKHMAGAKSNDSAYKATRPSRILRSEKLVTPVT